ncbi:hypothetical protein FPSE_02155 [Fusarium pseudograminearum CS3096]|uniref:Uncharacterized protein n=1 Tax=Fusarium pseudograminearum (strain CS3096) TaxID=1028729 RepID=K3VQA5_FUSPC|nr:hypothetical protein FPSE_02155 [Fusarium pseudograminearum CS3096]EKJ77657.1 hypothetical protein FPSE_02155 [Fusarium pseudograminearum CS3096]
MTPQKIEEPQGPQDNGTSASTTVPHGCIFSSGPMFEEPDLMIDDEDLMIEERLDSGDSQYEKALGELEAESKAKKAGEIDEEQGWRDFVDDLTVTWRNAIEVETRAFEVEEKAYVQEKQAIGEEKKVAEAMTKLAEKARKIAMEEKQKALEELKAAWEHFDSLREKKQALRDASSSGTARGRCQLMDEVY